MIKTDFNYNRYQNITPNNSPKCTSRAGIKVQSDTVSFKGHLGAEKLAQGSIQWLRHETAFFRDIQTKEFVKEYIEKNFANKDKIKIVVGACSSGEEAITYSMLLDALKNKVKIIGFDLSQKSVEQAKSKKFLMQRIKETPDGVNQMYTGNYSAFDDVYLAFDSKKALTPEQMNYKKLFDEFFEIANEAVPEEKLSLGTRFKHWYMKKLLKIYPPEFEGKIAQLKEGKAANCKFSTGDIMNLGEVTKNEKADVITFSNAMYHLITDDIGNLGFRQLHENAKDITRNIARNVKENLNPKGIFVLGEEEVLQTMDNVIVPKIFKEFGFKALNETDAHAANVWQLL